MALFGVEFGAQAGEGAGGFGGFVGGAGDAFAGAFVVVEAGWVIVNWGCSTWGFLGGRCTVFHVVWSIFRCTRFGASIYVSCTRLVLEMIATDHLDRP